DQPLDDLFVADPAWLHADFFAMRRNEFLDHRIGYRLAIAGLVAIPAGPGLLAEAADLAELVGNRRVLVVGLFDIAPLADVPADVVAGEIGHPERAHRETELL